jgi:hypothetical protein
MVIYATGDKNGVVGICEATSRSFLDRSEVWPRDYPHRVRIRPIFDTTQSPISMNELVGRQDDGIEVTPYLLGRGSIIELRPSERIASFLAKKRISTKRAVD